VKEIGKTLTKILFYFVAVVLLIWTASLTVDFISTALPSMPWYVPYLALVVFDGGMIAWMFVFLRYAEGTIQRAVALGLVMFDFLGVALLVMADILLGGQTMTAAPAGLGTWAVWGIGIWTIVNVLGVLAFHIGDPEAQVQMSIQNEKDAIFRGALGNLSERRTANSKMLADTLGSRMYQQMLDELMVDRDANGIPDALEGSFAIPGVTAPHANGQVVTFPAQTNPAPVTITPRPDIQTGRVSASGVNSQDGGEPLTEAERARVQEEFRAYQNARSSSNNGSNFPLK